MPSARRRLLCVTPRPFYFARVLTDRFTQRSIAGVGVVAWSCCRTHSPGGWQHDRAHAVLAGEESHPRLALVVAVAVGVAIALALCVVDIAVVFCLLLLSLVLSMLLLLLPLLLWFVVVRAWGVAFFFVCVGAGVLYVESRRRRRWCILFSLLFSAI